MPPLFACLATDCIHNQGKFPHACKKDGFVHIKAPLDGVPECQEYEARV